MNCKNCSPLRNITVAIFFLTFVAITVLEALKEPPPSYDDETIFWEQHDNGTIMPMVIGNMHSTEDDFDETQIRFFLTVSDDPTFETEYHGPFNGYSFWHLIPQVDTYIICHGYMSNHHVGPAPEVIPGLFGLGRRINVFNIDWDALQYTWRVHNYFRAIRATKHVGKMAAELVKHLVRLNLIDFSHVHFIGHSLGGHIGGFTGKNTRPFGNIGRITGLDPAGFKFEGKSPADRLDANDAHYVDVIHTSIFRPMSTVKLGYTDPLGDIDFYPNGGLKQPGCGLDPAGVCSHSRSYMLMAESIPNTYHFHSWKCESWKTFLDGRCGANERSHMGLHVSRESKGVYYLETGSEPPYAKVPPKNPYAPSTNESSRIRDLELALNNFERIVIAKENIQDIFRLGQVSHAPLEFYLQMVNKLNDRVLETFALKELRIMRHDGSIPFNVYSACLVFNNRPLQSLKQGVPQHLARIFSNAVSIELQADHRALNFSNFGRGNDSQLITSSFPNTGDSRRTWQIKPLPLENNCWFTITNTARNLSIGVDSRNGSNFDFNYWTSSVKRNINFLWKIIGSTTRGDGKAFVIQSAKSGLALDAMDDGTVHLKRQLRPSLWKFI